VTPAFILLAVLLVVGSAVGAAVSYPFTGLFAGFALWVVTILILGGEA
jgi:hypothetical protein